jgi:parallel beta-helix repeat protein
LVANALTVLPLVFGTVVASPAPAKLATKIINSVRAATERGGRMKKLIVVAIALIALGGWQGLAQAHNTRTQVACTTPVGTTILTADCTGSITVSTNGATLNCNGHTVSGTGGGAGIILPGRSGVTVENCNVKNFGNNFDLKGSPKNRLLNNTSLHNTSSAGFYLVASRGNLLLDNLATGGATSGVSRGFFLGPQSSGNSLRDNTAVGNPFRGFDIQSGSNGNVFTDNIAINNGSAGFVVFNANQEPVYPEQGHEQCVRRVYRLAGLHRQRLRQQPGVRERRRQLSERSREHLPPRRPSRQHLLIRTTDRERGGHPSYAQSTCRRCEWCLSETEAVSSRPEVVEDAWLQSFAAPVTPQ